MAPSEYFMFSLSKIFTGGNIIGTAAEAKQDKYIFSTSPSKNSSGSAPTKFGLNLSRSNLLLPLEILVKNLAP
jgi:hypothetical protein